MDIVKTLLKNRGLTTQKQITEFFHPIHPEKIKSPFDPKPAIRLIKSHIKKGSKTAIYGDYDVDGICSTAILWETLYSQYPNVFPHIPHRESEGYGLSIKGIDHCLSQGAKLIITVDNGIVAHEQIDYIKQKDCDVIIIDHHEPEAKLPKADVILHSAACCAAGLAWFFARDYLQTPPSLELPTIATVCDMMPLLRVNRSFVKHGLEELKNTTRLGLLALFQESAIKKISTYEIGYIIGPRINAMGRLEHAIDSLRLLCTKDPARARGLAASLSQTNRTRQEATLSALNTAMNQVTINEVTNLIITADQTYHQGIIGLVASKLVEKYHRPAIAISIGETHSKGSARSIPGFNITDHLRTASHLLAEIGGHAMAAGFTVENSKLEIVISKLTQIKIDPDLLVKKQRIDAVIPLSTINSELTTRLKEFEPYGLGNPTPVFSTPGVEIADARSVGRDSKHIKLKIKNLKLKIELDGIYFNAPKLPDNPVDIIYSVEQDVWNGQSRLQLVIKDVHPSS